MKKVNKQKSLGEKVRTMQHRPAASQPSWVISGLGVKGEEGT